MRRFLRMLLLVTAPVLLASAGQAQDLDPLDDYYGPPVTEVEVNLLGIVERPNGDILTSFGFFANPHQICVCLVLPPRVACRCQQPVMGLCIEVES